MLYIIKSVIVVMLIILLAAVSVAGIISFVVNQTVLQPEFYLQLLADHQIYGLMLESIEAEINLQLLQKTPAIIREIIASHLRQQLTEQWLQQQSVSIINGMLAYLKGEEVVLVMPVSLTELKLPLISQLKQNPLVKLLPGIDQIYLRLEQNIPDILDTAILIEDKEPLENLQKVTTLLPVVPGMTLGISLLLIVLLWLLGGLRLFALLGPGIALLLAGLLLSASGFWGPRVGMIAIQYVNIPREFGGLTAVQLQDLLASTLTTIAQVLLVKGGLVVAAGAILVFIAILFRPKTRHSI